MSDEIDKEVEAIGVVLKALEPLNVEVRASVIEYIIRRLQIKTGNEAAQEFVRRQIVESSTPSLADVVSREVHLTELVAEKKPQSAIEMAVLVAYYLSNSAPASERKESITTKDIETYFKIGGYRLPSKPQFTLPNTKNAGYLDAQGNGEYKLNPVGYNLVVHSMPTSSQKATVGKRTKRKTAAKKSVTPSND